MMRKSTVFKFALYFVCLAAPFGLAEVPGTEKDYDTLAPRIWKNMKDIEEGVANCLKKEVIQTSKLLEDVIYNMRLMTGLKKSPRRLERFKNLREKVHHLSSKIKKTLEDYCDRQAYSAQIYFSINKTIKLNAHLHSLLLAQRDLFEILFKKDE